MTWWMKVVQQENKNMKMEKNVFFSAVAEEEKYETHKYMLHYYITLKVVYKRKEHLL